MGSWFEARKDGKCTHCKSEVTIGEQMYAKGKGVYLCRSCGLSAEATQGLVLAGGIEEATLRDLGNFPEEARETSMAVSMLFLARQLDQGDVSPREVTLYTKELRLMFMQLRDLYPEQTENDETDKARERRERRMREQGGILCNSSEKNLSEPEYGTTPRGSTGTSDTDSGGSHDEDRPGNRGAEGASGSC